DNDEGRPNGGVRWVRPARSTSGGADRIVDVDVSWLVPADLAAVDALARLQVSASRRGLRLQFPGADRGLGELVEFVGMGDLLYLCPGCSSFAPSCPPLDSSTTPARGASRTGRTGPGPGRRGWR